MIIYLNMLETEDDRDVCQKLYEENKQRLFRIANKILQNTADAEDVVQICFSKIIGDFDDYRKAILDACGMVEHIKESDLDA